MRFAPAVRRFVQDVAETRKVKFTAKPYGEPDTFGTTRSVEFDANTSKWLLPILKAFTDPRIGGYSTSGGKLVVTFVDDHRADSIVPFPLGAVESVLSDDGIGDDPRNRGK